LIIDLLYLKYRLYIFGSAQLMILNVLALTGHVFMSKWSDENDQSWPVFVDVHIEKDLNVIFNYTMPSPPIVAGGLRPLVLKVVQLWTH